MVMTESDRRGAAQVLTTSRLRLRAWKPGDAPLLLPVLEANTEHLRGWIPEHVWKPAPLPELAVRLAGFADDFAAARSWRFGMFSPDEQRVLGEVGVFPRSAAGRVPVAEADRLEIGYWLRADDTGRGYVTEAVRAVLSFAADLRMPHVEIRCDPLNVRSAAVPRRLGFRLAAGDATGSVASDDGMMLWIHSENPT